MGTVQSSASGSAPLPSHLNQIFDDWKPRLFMLLICWPTLLLAILGLLRKMRRTSQGLQVFTWLVFTLVNGLSFSGFVFPLVDRSKIDGRSVALWAPFLLLLNGGIDTLNAYSLEDNRLWSRAAVFMLIRVFGCVFVISQCSFSVPLLVIVLPVLFTAFSNYGERIWVHRWGSLGDFQHHKWRQDQEDNKHKIAERLAAEALRVERCGNQCVEMKIHKPSTDDLQLRTFPDISSQTAINSPLDTIRNAFLIKERFEGLFSDRKCSRKDREVIQPVFVVLGYKGAFQVVETLMSFMQDEIYTRAPAFHTRWGWINRLCSFAAMLVSFFAFIFFLDKKGLPDPDIYVSWQLYIIDFFVRLCSPILLLLSPKNMVHPSAARWVEKFIPLISMVHPIKSSRLSIGQFDLWGYMKTWLQYIDVLGYLQPYFHTRHDPMSDKLKGKIFQVFVDKCTPATRDWPLENDLLTHGWTKLTEKELNERLSIWSIATNLCCAVHHPSPLPDELKIAKQLADYLLYLLMAKSDWFSSSVASDAVRTCVATVERLRKKLHDDNAFLENVVRRHFDILISSLGDSVDSVLCDACKLAQQLELLDLDNKEEILERGLVELLSYVSLQCRGSSHAQLLGEGTELITLISVFAVLFGFAPDKEVDDGLATTISVCS